MRRWPFRWSCLLKALLHWLQWYFLSSLCVRRCLANADALLKVLEHVVHAWKVKHGRMRTKRDELTFI